jgi:CRISPR/Cas system-associated endonuclease Cas3-HD
LDDQFKGEMVEDLQISKADFERNSDIVPVSDPHIFSETQRMAQMQSVMQLMATYPQSFDQNAVLTRVMKQLKIPNANELMPSQSKAQEMDAANENAAMALGKQAFAYARQDQLAHIQTHLDFALDPNLGSNPLISQTYTPLVMEHIKQHMMLWYTNQMETYVTAGSSMQLGKYEDNKLANTLDKAMAIAAAHVKLDSAETFAKVVPALQELGKLMQQFQQKPPMDSDAEAVLQASLAETKRRATRDQADVDLKKRDQEIKVAMNAENNLTTERIKTADISAEEIRLRSEQEKTAIQLNQQAQRDLRI